MYKQISLRRAFATAGFFSALALTPAAQATITDGPGSSVGTCAISGNLNIRSLHLVVGKSKGRGRGTIACAYSNGAKERIPVLIRTTGYGVGLGASSVNAALYSGGIGVAKGGETLLGKYFMSKAGAQIIDIGADIGVSITAKRSGFSIPLELKLKRGPGLELAADIGSMTIERDRSRN